MKCGCSHLFLFFSESFVLGLLWDVLAVPDLEMLSSLRRLLQIKKEAAVKKELSRSLILCMIYITPLIQKLILLCFIVTYPDNLSTDYNNGQTMVHVPFISLVYWLCCAAVQLLILAGRLCWYFAILSVVSSLLQLTSPLGAVAFLRTPGLRLSWRGRLWCRLLVFPGQLPPPVLREEDWQ